MVTASPHVASRGTCSMYHRYCCPSCDESMWQHPLDEATGERSGVNVVLQPSGGLVDCVVPRLLVPTVPCFHAKLLSGEATRS